MPSEESNIPLARVIADLRAELLTALKEGVGRELQFRLQPIELELKLGVTKSVDGNAGVKFWVMELGAKGGYESASTHTLKLVLEPVGPSSQSPNQRQGGRCVAAGRKWSMINLFNKGVAEVVCPTLSTRGSGFLLGKGLILTARHVLAPEDGGTSPDELSIQVRLAASKGKSPSWSDAELAWPLSTDELTTEPDIALLRVKEGPLAGSTVASIDVMGADQGADLILKATHKAVAVGFPNLGDQGRQQGNGADLDGHRAGPWPRAQHVQLQQAPVRGSGVEQL